MALIIKDRVKETTTTTGTGALSLGGAESNFVAFSSVLSDGDTTYYGIVDSGNTAFEVGLGTYTASGNTLARTTVLASSNSGSAVDLQSGSKFVFCAYPADKAVFEDANGAIVVDDNVTIQSGLIDLKNDGTVSRIRLYCESANAHFQTLEAAPHSEAASNTLVLPSAGSNLVSDTATQTLTNKTLTSPKINDTTAITATGTEINYLDIAVLGTSEASKAVTADANGVVTFDNGTIEESTALSGTSVTINLRDGDNFTHTLSGNTTYTFSNPAATGKTSSFTLKVTQDVTARTITWPTAVRWAGGTAPTISTGSGDVDVFVFITYDGGTNYYGFTSGQDMS